MDTSYCGVSASTLTMRGCLGVTEATPLGTSLYCLSTDKKEVEERATDAVISGTSLFTWQGDDAFLQSIIVVMLWCLCHLSFCWMDNGGNRGAREI